MKWRPSLRIWLLLAIYWTALFVATHIPNLNLADVHIHTTDLFLHGLSFWLLTLLYWLAVHGRKRPDFRRRQVYYDLLILAGYAVMDELSQELVHRSAGWHDWFADIIGIVSAVIMLYLFRRTFYWLIVVGAAFFILRHRGQWSGQELVSGPWLEYRALFYTIAYLALTLLFWRSLCRHQFCFSPRIITITLLALAAYIVLDEVITIAWGGRFSFITVLGAVTGIATGIITALALVRHNRLAHEPYNPSPSS